MHISEANSRTLQAVVFFALAAVASLVPAFRFWPLLWLVPGSAFVLLGLMFKPLLISRHRWNVGVFSSFAVTSAIVIAVGSVAALLVFQHFAKPDLSGRENLLPITALGGVLFAGIIFCLFNAAIEEIVFRGLLFDAVESQWGKRIALFASAAIFGYGHLESYPPGIVGVFLATIYGFALGWLRIVSLGLGLPVLAHIAADATIFVIFASVKH